MTLWLYLHFPALQLDSLFADSAALPVCILHKNQVVQLTLEAHNKGIKPGMGLGSAAALCHQLQVFPYDEKAEQEKLKEIAHWLYLVTSDISLQPPSGILLKVSNMLTLYDGLQSYWQTLSAHLKQLNIRFQYATALSPLAARLLARQAVNQISENPDQIKQALKRQPLTATELSPKTIQGLNRVGVQSLQELLSLELADVARRFDIDLVNYAGRLTGQFKHPVDFYYPPEHFKRYLELLFEIENLQWLEKPLLQLFRQLEQFLKLRDKLACELCLTLHQRDGLTQSVLFSSAQGDYLADKWARLSQLTLESVTLDAPVTGITLTAERIRPQQPDSQDLFAGRQGSLSPAELISLLQAKLGKEQVSGVTLTDDPRPEKSTQLCSPQLFSSQQGSPLQQSTSGNGEPSAVSSLLRPSILLPQPAPLNEKVSIIQGPERLATGWWDCDEVIRDYFVAKSSQGRWLWVFRNRHKQWFIHGLFA